MAAYTIINSSDAQLVNVNAGGTDVDSLTYKTGVTLTNTELAALLALANVAVMADAATSAQRRVVSIAGGYLSA
jgi:hypothetical protein